MRKNKVIIFFLIIFFITTSIICIFFISRNYYKNTIIDSERLTEKPTNPFFNPASLNWEQVSAPWQGRDSQAVVVYKGKIWLMGGVDGTSRLISPGNVDYGNAIHFSDVWSSEDGKNWQLVLNKAPWGERRSMQVVDFKGKMWLMGGWGPEIGYKNNIWSSENGVDWKLERMSAEWPAREGHQLLVFKNRIWLIGGVRYGGSKLFTDIWSSEDGIDWVEEIKDAGWSPRWDFISAVFNNKIWTIGGMDLKGNLYKDIWSSEDGKKWSLAEQSPPFVSRQGFALLDYEGRLWIIGRLNTPEYGNGVNDVWYSDNGINWKKTNLNPVWPGREDVGAVVFKNKMWVLGGMDKNWKWTNDVWYSTSNLDVKELNL